MVNRQPLFLYGANAPRPRLRAVVPGSSSRDSDVMPAVRQSLNVGHGLVFAARVQDIIMIQKRLLVFRQHGGDSIPLIKFGHGNSHGRTDTSQSDNTGRSRSAKEVAYVICGINHSFLLPACSGSTRALCTVLQSDPVHNSFFHHQDKIHDTPWLLYPRNRLIIRLKKRVQIDTL